MKTFSKQVSNIHFIGIGGVGMSGIAEVLSNLNYKVTGSDISETANITHLKACGIKIFLGHHASNIVNADVVVTSSAIASDNPEIIAAQKNHIPVIPRAMMLAELMRFKQGIAVAGTHGKTTTTSLIASIFAFAKLDPTYVIGGKLLSLGKNAALGSGDYFIAEADESDASFLHLNPMVVIVTNIDKDHLATYNHDFDILKHNFLEFSHKLPFYGQAILCLDDPELASIIPQVERPTITYGFNPDADVVISDYKQIANCCSFHLSSESLNLDLQINLPIPGKHNALNTAAAVICACNADIPVATIQQALSNFSGIARRLEIRGDFQTKQNSTLLIDDYGHHPSEVAAVITAIREGWPQKRLIMVYQPHRYTRTRDLFDEFVAVLSKVDSLVLLDVYAAGENPIIGATSPDLATAIAKKTGKNPVVIPANQAKILQAVQSQQQQDDIILMQGAGDIYKITPYIAEKLAITNSVQAYSQ